LFDGIVFAGIVLAVDVGLVQTPKYRASSDVLVEQPRSSTLLDQNAAQAPDMIAELKFAESMDVRNRAVQRLGYDANATVANQLNSRIISFAASGPGSRSVAIANAFVDAFISLREEQETASYLAARAALTRAMADVESQLGTANPSDRTRLAAQQAAYQSALERVNVAWALAPNSGQSVLSRAVRSKRPVSPNFPLYASFGSVAGIFLGAVAVAVAEATDPRIRDPLAVRRLLAGRAGALVVDGLGQGGRARGLRARRNDATARDLLVCVAPPPTRRAAYAVLRPLVTTALTRRTPVLLIASASEQDDAGAAVAHLAAAVRSTGGNPLLVCLVGCGHHLVADTAFDPGVAEFLNGRATLAQATRPHPEAEDVAVLIGAIPSAALLAQPSTTQAFKELREAGGQVIVHSGPVGSSPQALQIAGLADATVLTVRLGVTRTEEFRQATAELDTVHTPVHAVLI
jgi:capsular polysaccharide biosynthesis protein